MVNKVVRYGCGICTATFETEAEAQKCEARGILDIDYPIEVGDVITCGHDYSWWEGSKKWRQDLGVQTRGTLRGRQTFAPIWIVVGKHPDGQDKGVWGHLMRYVLWTRSGPDGRPRVATTSMWHMPMTKIGRAAKRDLEEGKAAAAKIKFPNIV